MKVVKLKVMELMVKWLARGGWLVGMERSCDGSVMRVEVLSEKMGEEPEEYFVKVDRGY